MTSRHTVDTITSDALDALYERVERAERERTEAAQLSHRYRNDAERAEAAIARVRAALPPYKAPVHGDTSRGIQIGWDRARETALAALAALDASAPLTDADGRAICTCTWVTPCGCGTSPHYGPAPAATQAADGDCCGAEPPPADWVGDCWCTLPPGHEGEHRCQPCADRHGAPGWADPKKPS